MEVRPAVHGGTCFESIHIESIHIESIHNEIIHLEDETGSLEDGSLEDEVEVSRSEQESHEGVARRRNQAQTRPQDISR